MPNNINPRVLYNCMKYLIPLLLILLTLNTVLADSIWLMQNKPFTIGDHTIMVLDVDSSATKCGVIVDGQIKWLDKNHGEHFGEVYIFVLDVIAVNTQNLDGDRCELLITGIEIEEEPEIEENITEPNITLYEEEVQETEEVTEKEIEEIVPEPVEEKSLIARIISFILSLFE
jgi:hypothetical protein